MSIINPPWSWVSLPLLVVDPSGTRQVAVVVVSVERGAELQTEEVGLSGIRHSGGRVPFRFDPHRIHMDSWDSYIYIYIYIYQDPTLQVTN